MLTVAFVAYTDSSFELTVDEVDNGDKAVSLFKLRYDKPSDRLTEDKAVELALGTSQAFEVRPGVYSVSTQNSLKYAVIKGTCDAHVKSGKDPWPTPPPPPPPFKTLSEKVWNTYVDVVGGGSDGTDIEIKLVAIVRDPERPRLELIQVK